MNKKTLKKRSKSKRAVKSFLYFRLAVAAMVAGVFVVLGMIGNNSLAQSWSEPTSAPPLNNASAPIWNQTSTAQTAGFYISGRGRFDTTGTGDVYCTNGKVCGVDAASSGGSNGAVGESNTGYGMYASSVSNYGLVASSGTSYAGYFLGNVYVNGIMNAVNGLQVNGTNVCLADGTHCLGGGSSVLAFDYTGPVNPAGTSVTTGVAMGLNTPIVLSAATTGRIKFMITGTLKNNSSGAATSLQAYISPTNHANGTVPDGTAIGGTATNLVPFSTSTSTSFSLSGTATGLAAGTWYLELGVSPSAGTSTVRQVVAQIEEY